MKESNFQGEFKKCLSLSGYWITKFADVVGGRFTLQKPFDFIAVKDGRPFAFELKMVKKYQAIKPRDFIRGKELKDPEIKANWLLCNQASSLDAFELAGGVSYLVINVRNRELRLNEVVFLRWPFARKMIVEGELTAEKLQWLAESPMFSSTMKKGMFKF